MEIFFQDQTNILTPLQKTDYIVGTDLLANLHKIPTIKEKDYSSFLVLADKTVFDLYGEKVVGSLKKFEKPVVLSVIPPGEAAKNMENISKFIAVYFRQGFDRKASLVCLGGGAITDIGGFIASILLRGIALVYIPTTLLGQIDAAIGGKTGVNFWLSKNLMYKNMIGTFKQPDLVISDIGTLSSLPEKEVLNGLAEMVKYWVGWGRPTIKHLGWCPELAEGLLGGRKSRNDPKTPRGWQAGAQAQAVTPPKVKELVKTISTCQKIKINIVQKDPFDTKGIREKLNLGHTIGHAIEGVLKGKLSHGEAVSIGLVATAKISVAKGLLVSAKCRKIIKTIEDFNLPTKFSDEVRPRYPTRSNLLKEIKNALKIDKKGETFVLIKDIGELITGVLVEERIINQTLEEIVDC